MRLFFINISLLLAAAALTGCPAPHKNQQGTQARTVQMGDPLNLFRGANNNPNPDLTAFKKPVRTYIHTIVDFASKQKFDPSKKVSQSTIEGEQAASKEADKDASEFILSLLSYEETTKTLSIKLYGGEGANLMSIEIPMESELEPVFENSYVLGRKVFYFTGKKRTGTGYLVHYSSTPDLNNFSFLFYDVDNVKKESLATAVYMTNSKETSYKKVSDEYFYTRGPGVKIGWDKSQKIKLDICNSSQNQLLSYEVEDAATRWNLAMNESELHSPGRPYIETQVIKSNFKPFTDLNQHGLYIIDDFMEDPDSRSATFGATITAIDNQKGQIVDSDILIFKKEFLKAGVDILNEKLDLDRNYTIVHELGHFMGLDHQFNNIKSVMSYDYENIEPTDYDKRAIRALYE